MSEIKTLESKIVYKNRWMQVREDRIQRPSGQEGIYSVVDKPDFAIIAAIDHGFIYLVEQYRYPVQKRCLEMPQGAWEGQSDVDPLTLAQGELQEETGLRAKKMTAIGFQYLAYGFSTQGYHIYLAQELTQGEQSLEPEEEGLSVQKMKLSDFESMIVNGEIEDASTVNAYCLIKLKGYL